MATGDQPGPRGDAPPGDRVAAGTPAPGDERARRYAVDPRHDVVLEASAGTGKTSVLVERYLNLLRAGVDPANILAITFTRKAAAEMRGRIVAELKAAASRDAVDRVRWRELRERLADISVGTIDAFCLSLLREFPLEADLDPAFALADETETSGLVTVALDRTMGAARSLAAQDDDLSLLLVQLGEERLRQGLQVLLERRLVAPGVLARFVAGTARELTAEAVSRAALQQTVQVLEGLPGGLAPFVATGPQDDASYRILVHDLSGIAGAAGAGAAAARRVMDALRSHFLTGGGTPRKRPAQRKASFPSAAAYAAHRDGLALAGPQLAAILANHRRQLNLVLARGARLLFGIALTEYRRALERRAIVDFAEALERAIALLGQMDEFARSRFRLESRFHHVLVDELQDTSRAQWELVALLIRSWGEGAGVVSEAAVPPSIFVVGDRKQSIYRFRDAEVGVLEEAASFIGRLRAGGSPRRWISTSFRAVPALLAFVNDVFDRVDKLPGRTDAFRYDDRDRFPLEDDAVRGEAADTSGAAPPVIGLAVGGTPRECASVVAGEIARVLREETVRDRRTGLRRPATAGDVAILFRARQSHQEYERALEALGIPAYVYKGLGFYEAEEVQDVLALIRYLADPASDLCAAAFLRSRFVRMSDRGLVGMLPSIAASLKAPVPGATGATEDERVLERTRASLARWQPLVDRVPPAELLDRILHESAYACELAGPRRLQAWENLKKLRALVRRLQNRGYATMSRLAGELQRMSAGDESNAVVDALEAVSLMTVHAAKGLEFPVVFVVQLERGVGGGQPPIRVTADDGHGHVSVSVGAYQSESDEDERAREREETKRLLYVAFTRARDRLYLSASLRDGLFRPGPGSLGEVLPGPLGDVLTAAVTSPAPTLTWQGQGSAHIMRRCAEGAEEFELRSGPETPAPPRSRDFSRVDDQVGRRRSSVTEIIADDDPRGGGGAEEPSAGDDERLLGRLVHRLLQNRTPGDDGEVAVSRRAEQLLDPHERADADGDPSAVAAEAARRYLKLSARDDVRALLESGPCAFEVPFSARLEDVLEGRGGAGIVRGTIDAVVRGPDQRLTIIELKTGAPRAWHQRQVEMYRRAVQAGFPGVEVDAVLLYC